MDVQAVTEVSLNNMNTCFLFLFLYSGNIGVNPGPSAYGATSQNRATGLALFLLFILEWTSSHTGWP